MIRFSSAALAALLSLAPASSLPAQQHGVNIASMDRAVKPGDDFFRYANGMYLSKATIPADRSSISVFSQVNDRAEKQVAEIVTDPSFATAPEGSEKRKIADLYQSYMNEAAIEAHGRAALAAQLKPILAIKDRHTLAAELGRSLRDDVDPLNAGNFHTANLFGLWVGPGFNDPEHYTPYFFQGGTGLQSREYYTSESPRMKQVLDAYGKHLEAMFRLLRLDQADQRATAVLALETVIAQQQTSIEDSENIGHANNVWNAADFEHKAPGLEWKTYFAAAKLGRQKSLIVWQPAAIRAESALVASQPVAVWKDLLLAHLVDAYEPYLSKPFAMEHFEYTRAVTGTQAERPRPARAVSLTSAVLGDAVGRIYADRFFAAEDKARVEQLVANLLAAYRQRLMSIPWMTPATRAEALAKLDTLNVSVGYPQTWENYSDLDIRPDDLFGNMWRSGEFGYSHSLGRIGMAVDRNEWSMTPQMVNAVQMPLDNALNFPAAILQAPFYDRDRTDAGNYGAIDAVIGHEISHTFDSEGSAFDSTGRVRNWWTAADLAHFNASTETLARQYDTYFPFPDLHLNGRQTLPENIADVAGVQAAYDAYRASLHGKEAPVRDGLTGDQQFFIAFAQNYASAARETSLRAQILRDQHSPGQYRALTVRNVDAWYAAFDVVPGQALYLKPDQRVHIY